MRGPSPTPPLQAFKLNFATGSATYVKIEHIQRLLGLGTPTGALGSDEKNPIESGDPDPLRAAGQPAQLSGHRAAADPHLDPGSVERRPGAIFNSA